MAIKILYVEDNPINAEIVRRTLTRSGYQILEAKNGANGIALALQEKPDLILLDINLPDINGVNVCARLKGYEGLSHIPIIALTANAMHGDHQRYLAAGFDDYISKPV